MLNADLIRHWRKMKTIPINATMVLNVAHEYGSFGQFLAQWPTNNIVGLWQFIKKQGAHLGGDGGARFLRMAGKDTFVLSSDVTRALINAGVVTRKPTGLRDLTVVQHFFNDLAQQSQRPLCQVSMVLALSIGPN
jgi:3-methyladenine DNA glycosylase Tag